MLMRGWGESQPFLRLLTADATSRRERAQALMDYHSCHAEAVHHTQLQVGMPRDVKRPKNWEVARSVALLTADPASRQEGAQPLMD
jgi:hypothetical protein